MSEIARNSASPPALILAGPTGIGKTAIAVELARRHGFELISADSMQVYRGMEIGTAQPTEAELRGVRIHACGVLRPDEPFSVKRFLDICDDAHREIAARGRTPLYVGGTGMYLRALRWGLFDQPEVPAELRARLKQEVERRGPNALHERLKQIDPALSERIPPTDPIRIMRGLEVAETMGRPLSSLQGEWERGIPRFPHVLAILNCPRPVLINRIEKRVEEMLAAGWIDEARRLLDAGYSPRLHCFKALGYREIIRHTEGEISREEMETQIKAKTRQFAKRQMTWFRKERDANWIEFDGVDASPAIEQIEILLAGHSSIT
jgi:tRNA dimethylallyltransferase